MLKRIFVYDKATSIFLSGGFYDPLVDPVTQGTVTFDDGVNVDLVLDRFDAVLGQRPATQEELEVAEAVRIDAEASRSIDEMRVIKAAVLTSLWGRLGRQPTRQEIADERSRFIAIYKAL